MPTSFEFVIPENFLFIPANLSYISFCIFASFLLFKIFRSKLFFIVCVVLGLSVFYHDIFLKYGIKNFYELTSYNSTFLKKAPKNEYGRAESLSTIKVYGYDIKQLANLSSSSKEKIVSSHENYIEKFIDIPSLEYRFKRYKYKKIRLFLNGYEFNDESKDKSIKARFEIKVEKVKSLLPSIYDEYKYRFVDNNTNEVLASAYYVKFLNKKGLRHKLLYWNEQRDQSFTPLDIQNFDEVYKKVFIE